LLPLCGSPLHLSPLGRDFDEHLATGERYHRQLNDNLIGMIEITVSSWTSSEWKGWSKKPSQGAVPVGSTTMVEEQGDGPLLTLSGLAESGSFFKLTEGLAGKQAEKLLASDWRRQYN